MKLKQLFIVCALCACLVGCSSSKSNINSTEVVGSTENIIDSTENDDSVINEIKFSVNDVLSDFNYKENKNYFYTTSVIDDSIVKNPVVLNNDIIRSDSGLSGRVYFSLDYSLYLDFDNNASENVMSYDEMTKKGLLDLESIDVLKESTKNMYYDIIVVDAYTSICGDENSDIKSYYNSLGGAREKAERGDSYTVKYNSYGREVVIEYNYGMDGEKPYVDIKAEYPEGYDGIRILGLGQDRSSCAGMYATVGDESIDSYIDKKDLSKIFKVWGTDNDKDFLELTNYSDFIFNKKDLYMDTVSLCNQYFFGGSLGVCFSPNTFVYIEDGSSYTIPVEETWINMLKTQTITIYNPYLD